MERTFRLRRGYIGDPYTRSTAMIPVAKIGPTLIHAHPTINCVVTILPPLTKNETLVCLFEGAHQCDRPRPTRVELTVCDRRCYCYKCSGRNEIFIGPLRNFKWNFRIVLTNIPPIASVDFMIACARFSFACKLLTAMAKRLIDT